MSSSQTTIDLRLEKIMLKINEKQVIKMYKNGDTMKKISEFFGCSDGPIRRILRKEGFDTKLKKGCNSRICSLDETFFDQINTSEKAYILGWIVSDGYVNNYKLSFCVKDLEILKKIKKAMNSEHKISNSVVYDKRTKKHYQRYSLQIGSKKIVASLNKLGVYQNKSFTVDLPNVPEKFKRDLIRGIFDGDGYIGIKKCKKGHSLRFSLTVTDKIYVKLNIIFNKLGIAPKKPTLVAEKNNNKIVKILIYKEEDLRKFFKYIYGNGNALKLERKYKIYKSIY